MKEKVNSKIQQSLDEKFGHDTLISLATISNGVPYVRIIDSYYENGVFYAMTYSNTNKMKQIQENPQVAICGDWFTAHGIGENLGHPCDEKNLDINSKLKTVFSNWYYDRYSCDTDSNVCILGIRLTDAVLFHDGEEFDIDFTNN